MSARLVEAEGAAWQPFGDELQDPGVARDFVSSLSPEFGPTVVRVTASGGAAKARASIGGDWLCDASSSPRGRKSPPLQWLWAGREAEAWASGLQTVEAWEGCPRHRWMLAAAGYVGVQKRLIVSAQCACVRSFMRAARIDNLGEMQSDFEASERISGGAEAGRRAGRRAERVYAMPPGDGRARLAAASNAALEAWRELHDGVPIQYDATARLVAAGMPEEELCAAVRQAIPLLIVMRKRAAMWHMQSPRSRGGG